MIQTVSFYADQGDIVTATYILMIFYKDTIQIVPEISFNVESDLLSKNDSTNLKKSNQKTASKFEEGTPEISGQFDVSSSSPVMN